MVLFAEGGGGRPGDVDMPIVAGLDCRAFHSVRPAQRAGAAGRDRLGLLLRRQRRAAGLLRRRHRDRGRQHRHGRPGDDRGRRPRRVRAGEVGPIDVQYANGVVDLRVADDAEAVAAAKRYLAYFARVAVGGAGRAGAVPDQARLRDLIPANRKRVYDVRDVIDALFDEVVLELRRGFGPGMVTALARIDGQPLGVIANDPTHLGGAIDADGADKAARFMQLCDAFGLPLLFLCDTPGFMVGPEAERTATVRHFSRMFVTGANLERADRHDRAAQGLRPRRAGDGRRRASRRRCSRVGWPTSEFGGDGPRGRGPAGHAPRARGDRGPGRARARVTRRSSPPPTSAAAASAWPSYFEIDDVIDPADSRRWIATLFDEAPAPVVGDAGKRRPNVDAW